jgi:hypothetical protein
LLVLVLASPSFAKNRDFDPKAYAAAVARAEAGDPGVDYLWLRKQAAAQLDYGEAPWDKWSKADALVDTKPKEAMRMARERLSSVWTDFMAHIVAQMALEKLGKNDESAREADIVSGIVRSISGGHMGTSKEDAMNAVSVAEEYRVLALLRWRAEGQSLVNELGHTFDVFDVIDQKTQQKRQAWFDIDVFFGKEFGIKF